MTSDELLDVLEIVAAAKSKTMSKADAQIWFAIIGSLTKEVAMEAVRDHLRDKPGVWMEPGHIYQRGREIMRNASMNAVAKEVLPQPKAIEGSKQYSDEQHRRRLIEEFARKKMKSVDPLKPGEAESA